MALLRKSEWDPFRELEEITQRMNEWFGGALTPLWASKEGERALPWRPAVDILEDAEGYRIRMDLPGVKKEDLQVTLQEGVRTVEGERKFEKESKDQQVHRRELWRGRFVRSFRMPQDVDEDGIEAHFQDGVLEIRVRRRPQRGPKPKRIEVR